MISAVNAVFVLLRVVFSEKTFSLGTYTYTHVIDDEVVGSKQMIITE